jgi:hypothetical protein
MERTAAPQCWSGWRGQLIERGVHRNCSPTRITPMSNARKLGRNRPISHECVISPFVVNCARDPTRNHLGESCRGPGIPPAARHDLFGPCSCSHVFLDPLFGGGQIQHCSAGRRPWEPDGTLERHFFFSGNHARGSAYLNRNLIDFLSPPIARASRRSRIKRPRLFRISGQAHCFSGLF